ncbi:hypothetical protein THAOC_27103, partial [Thalassiosira oceanica]
RRGEAGGEDERRDHAAAVPYEEVERSGERRGALPSHPDALEDALGRKDGAEGGRQILEVVHADILQVARLSEEVPPILREGGEERRRRRGQEFSPPPMSPTTPSSSPLVVIAAISVDDAAPVGVSRDDGEGISGRLQGQG